MKIWCQLNEFITKLIFWIISFNNPLSLSVNLTLINSFETKFCLNFLASTALLAVCLFLNPSIFGWLGCSNSVVHVLLIIGLVDRLFPSCIFPGKFLRIRFFCDTGFQRVATKGNAVEFLPSTHLLLGTLSAINYTNMVEIFLVLYGFKGCWQSQEAVIKLIIINYFPTKEMVEKETILSGNFNLFQCELVTVVQILLISMLNTTIIITT